MAPYDSYLNSIPLFIIGWPSPRIMDLTPSFDHGSILFCKFWDVRSSSKKFWVPCVLWPSQSIQKPSLHNKKSWYVPGLCGEQIFLKAWCVLERLGPFVRWHLGLAFLQSGPGRRQDLAHLLLTWQARCTPYQDMSCHWECLIMVTRAHQKPQPIPYHICGSHQRHVVTILRI